MNDQDLALERWLPQMSELDAEDELGLTPERLSPPSSTPKKNAFSEMMAAKPKQSSKGRETRQVRTTQPTNPRDPRNGLLPYIVKPESFPSSLIIRYTEHSVLIRDAYPKSLLHLLLLPRDQSKYNLHPHTAFADPAFLALIRSESKESLQLATSELSRLLSPTSVSCKARIEAMESDTPPSELPPGRDFTKELRVGIHAHPSMNHLHLHIISLDMSRDSMKHRKHYNSFNTNFFIPLEDFPLADDDERRQVSYQNANLGKDFECWRCHRRFGNKFKELKAHLADEYAEWIKE